MANALYDAGREGFLGGDIDWDADTIKCILVDTAAYTVNLFAHDFIDDVAIGARVGTAVILSSKTKDTGVADAADVSFTGLVGAPSIEALIIFKDTGVESTSRLIAYIDTASGLPVSAGATQVDVVWSSGPNRIFKL